MSVGRVGPVHPSRLGCSVSTTVAGNDVVTLIPVDSSVVDFDQDGGQFLHQPTGDIYSYDSCDVDAETITLTAGLPTGKTLTADDALYVYPRSDDYYADVAIDDVATDVVSARIPQMLRAIIEAGTKEPGKGPLVRLQPGSEGWHVTEMVGEEPSLNVGTFYSGDIKSTARSVSGSGALIDGGWLKCDGTAVSRSTYATLFNAIDETFGAGDGSTTFNLPDMRSRFQVGAGTYKPLGGNEGMTEANRTTLHSHTIGATAHTGNSTATGAGGTDRVTTVGGVLSGSHNHGGDTGNGLGGGAMPNLALNFLIKT